MAGNGNCNQNETTRSATKAKSISAGKRNDATVYVISDSSDEDDEPQLQMLCEVQYDKTTVLPLPLEQKFSFKAEPEALQDRNCETWTNNKSGNDNASEQQINIGECENELLPLCNTDTGDNGCDSILNNNYIIYKCPQCGINFENIYSWKMHIDSVHNLSDQRTLNFNQRPNNMFQCNICNATITRCTLKTLQQHHFMHLRHKVYKCKLCPHEEHSMYLMISHIMLHKNKEELELLGDDESATLDNKTLEHEVKQFIAYICPVCGDSFGSESMWQAHINFRHNFLEKTAENRYSDHFKCTECNVEIFSQHIDDLQQHLFTHLPYKSFIKCRLCNWTVTRRNFMVSHIVNIHKLHLNSLSQPATIAALAPTSTDHSAKLSTSMPNVFIYDDDEEDNQNANHNNEHNDGNRITENNDDHNNGRNVDVDMKIAAIISANSKKQPQDDPEWTTSLVSAPYIKRGFMCNRCLQRFPTAAERNVHNVAEHGKYVCNTCNSNFAIKADMLRHKCMPKLQLECPVCLKEYFYEKWYRIHLRRCKPQKRVLRGNRRTMH